MALRLARHVEHTVHVDDMLDGLTHQQFDEWVAFDSIEPIGGEPDRHLLAFLVTLVANFMGQNVKFAELLPWWRKPNPEASSEDQVRSFLQSVGVRSNRNDR